MSAVTDIAEIKAAKAAVPSPSDIAIPSERSAAQHRLVVLDGLAAEIGVASQRLERAKARLEAAAEAAGTVSRQLRTYETDLARAGEAHGGFRSSTI